MFAGLPSTAMEYRPAGLSDEHLLLLGKVSVAAAIVEYELGTLLRDLVHPDHEHAGAVLGQMSFDRAASLTVVLAGKRLDADDPRLTRLKQLTKRAGDAMTTRNRLLHGRWARREVDGGMVPAVLTRTKRGDLLIELHATTAELSRVLEELMRIGEDLRWFYNGTIDWSGAFERMPDGSMRRIGYTG